jgi:DNA-binding NarL/FixJ family response regulator
LVDDHSLLRRGLSAFFEREIRGVVLSEAVSAEDAYELLGRAPVDVMVMDIHLPGDDGITAAAKIRKLWPKTKILMLSGQSDKALPVGEVHRALIAGADGFVSKADGDDCVIMAIAALEKGQIFLSPTPATELTRQIRRAETIQTDKKALTENETIVLKRLAEGASYKEIACELGIGVKTVDTYRTRLTGKLGFNSREELLQAARRLGLIS